MRGLQIPMGWVLREIVSDSRQPCYAARAVPQSGTAGRQLGSPPLPRSRRTPEGAAAAIVSFSQIN